MNKLKQITALAVIGLLTLTTQAQDNTFGVKGGVNFSNFYTENVDDENGKTVSILESIPEVRLSPNYFIYKQNWATPAKGAKIEGSLGEAELGLAYLELPVMASIGLADFIYLERWCLCFLPFRCQHFWRNPWR